ncbi:hypothetical protein X777_03343, partial [Ooceraea biroi]
RNDGARYEPPRRLVNLSTAREAIRARWQSGKRGASRTRARVRLHFLKRPRGKSLIGKSPGDYEAWKPSRRARRAAEQGRETEPEETTCSDTANLHLL